MPWVRNMDAQQCRYPNLFCRALISSCSATMWACVFWQRWNTKEADIARPYLGWSCGVHGGSQSVINLITNLFGSPDASYRLSPLCCIWTPGRRSVIRTTWAASKIDPKGDMTCDIFPGCLYFGIVITCSTAAPGQCSTAARNCDSISIVCFLSPLNDPLYTSDSLVASHFSFRVFSSEAPQWLASFGSSCVPWSGKIGSSSRNTGLWVSIHSWLGFLLTFSSSTWYAASYSQLPMEPSSLMRNFSFRNPTTYATPFWQPNSFRLTLISTD